MHNFGVPQEPVGGRADPHHPVAHCLTRACWIPAYAQVVERTTSKELEIEPVEAPEPPTVPLVTDREPEELEVGDARDEEDAEGAEPYFPPTDPVMNDRGREMIGGFERTSMDTLEVDPSTIDEEPGDEALADAVRRELREDATTSHLRLDVDVRRGVVFLRGRGEDVEDEDNAAYVASLVPGIREVVVRISTSVA